MFDLLSFLRKKDLRGTLHLEVNIIGTTIQYRLSTNCHNAIDNKTYEGTVELHAADPVSGILMTQLSIDHINIAHDFKALKVIFNIDTEQFKSIGEGKCDFETTRGLEGHLIVLVDEELVDKCKILNENKL